MRTWRWPAAACAALGAGLYARVTRALRGRLLLVHAIVIFPRFLLFLILAASDVILVLAVVNVVQILADVRLSPDRCAAEYRDDR